MHRDLAPIHPSEILKEDFMLPFGITSNQLATDIHLPVEQLEDFLAEKQPVTANLALRLASYFSTDAQSWLNLQEHYDLEIMQNTLENELKNFIKPLVIKQNLSAFSC
jgi:addiction module HigA family antidote